MSIVDKFRKNEIISFPFYELTRSKEYKEYLDFFKDTYDWEKEKIDNWQFDKVREMLLYAYEHVPFYKKYYDDNGVNPYLVKSWTDFEKIPCITKAIVKENEELFYSDEKDALKCRFDYTGGSTGQPMKFLIDEGIYQREDAAYRYYWNSVGFNVGEKCIILRGRKIYTESNKKVYEYNQFWNYMYLDSLYLSSDFFPLYDDAIKKYKANRIQAYPSSLIMLAKLYQIKGVTPPKFEYIFLGSENVEEEQLEFLKKTFSCKKIYNQYGHSEKVVLALQIPDGEALAFNPFYGYFELLDESNDVIKDEGRLGEIVGTGFSKSMPFIRYRTSDQAYLSNEVSNSYMRYWKKIKKIEGRLHEFIYTNDERKVSICTVGGAHIAELNNVIDMQYEQKEEGRLIVNILADYIVSEEEKKIIAQKYEKLFDNKINCEVHQVDNLKRTSRDKKIMLVQHIKDN